MWGIGQVYPFHLAPPLPSSPIPDTSPHPVLSTNQMQLVHNKQVYILHILPLLPPPGEDVPVLRCRHDDCPLLEEAEVSTGLPRQLHYLLAQSLAKPDMPVRVHLSRARKHTDRQTDRQTRHNRLRSNVCCKSSPPLLLTWSTRAFFGATYTHLPEGLCCSSRRMANSAQTVFPLPVGAPTNTLSSELYRELNTAREKEVSGHVGLSMHWSTAYN